MPQINIAKQKQKQKETEPHDRRFQFKSPSSVPLSKEISLDDSESALPMGLKFLCLFGLLFKMSGGVKRINHTRLVIAI